MSPSSRRHAIAACLVALLALVAGCSKKKSTPPNTEPQLTQEEADDIVQQLAYMTAVHSGGWILDVQSTVKATRNADAPTPVLACGRPSRRPTLAALAHAPAIAGG